MPPLHRRVFTALPGNTRTNCATDRPACAGFAQAPAAKRVLTTCPSMLTKTSLRHVTGALLQKREDTTVTGSRPWEPRSPLPGVVPPAGAARWPRAFRRGHGVGDKSGQRLAAILRSFLAAPVRLVAAPFAEEHRRRVRVRGSEQDVRSRNARPLLDEFARLDGDPFRHRDEIAHDNRRPRRRWQDSLHCAPEIARLPLNIPALPGDARVDRTEGGSLRCSPPFCMASCDMNLTEIRDPCNLLAPHDALL